jgi:hypothetical protein
MKAVARRRDVSKSLATRAAATFYLSNTTAKSR